MARKPTHAELTQALAAAEQRALVAVWMLRQAACYCAESYEVLMRPRSGPLVVRTDDHGCPSYWFEPLDSGRVAQEFRATENDEYARSALLAALHDAKILSKTA